MHLPRRKAAIAFILVTAMLDIVAMGIVIPVLPALIEQFAGSNARAGAINGVFVALWAAMQFIASPVIGSLSDQYGRRPVLLVSALGLSADYVLMAVAPNLWWLALGRIVTGITSASFTTVYAYMADITPPGERARAYEPDPDTFHEAGNLQALARQRVTAERVVANRHAGPRTVGDA